MPPLHVRVAQARPHLPCRECCLTPHSSRAPTAKHRARATVQFIICSAGPAFSCRCRLSSNVRRRTAAMSALVASKTTVAVLALGHGSGTTFKCSVLREVCARRKTTPVCAHWPAEPRKGIKPRAAARCSAERVAAVALHASGCEGVSSSYRRRSSQPGCFTPVTRRLKDQAGQPYRKLVLSCGFERWQEHKYTAVPGAVVVVQTLRPPFPSPTTPNPSFKPSPNGKAPGPRYSAGVLLLQRGPGALPLVPV